MEISPFLPGAVVRLMDDAGFEGARSPDLAGSRDVWPAAPGVPSSPGRR